MVLHGICVKISRKIKQFGLLVNIATTRHKLQGISKYVILVSDWDYRTQNWVYVVLSRVRKLNGVYLQITLDPKNISDMIHL